MKAASLFAGIGGFDLAAGRVGADVVLQAEIDPSAQAVLRARFPGVALVSDARNVDLTGIDLVLAGFPCQGLSAAAATRKAGGLIDPESESAVVWPVLDRVFAARPSFLLLENADSLGTARYADDLRTLLEALFRNGYFPHVVRLNAGCYGSVMRRTRTFILARRQAWIAPIVPSSVSWTCDVPLIGVNNQQGGATWCTQPSVTKKSSIYTLMVTPTEVRTLTPEAVEKLFGFPLGWTEAAGPKTARYARLGNSVSVDAATAALCLLLGQKFVSSTRTPSYSYKDLYPLTVPAGGGTAGSALGRFARTMDSGGRNPNYNVIERDYCLPVYVSWMQAHPDTVSDAMWGYLERIRPTIPTIRQWPSRVDVRMEQ
jgi:site-specific DNA-cytosine methylase